MEAMRSGMQSYYQKNAGMPAEQAFEASKNVNSVVTVSYTHLDVYKRQVLRTVIFYISTFQ